jgi:hypothetical protein
MQMSREEAASEFGKSLDNGDAAVFVGAGVSIAAGYPPWDGLVARLRHDLAVPSKFSDLPLLAQYYENQHGRDALEAAIADDLRAISTASPTIIHDLLAKVPVTAIWTTNFDQLLETAMPERQLVVDDEEFARLGDGSVQAIYKMHGSVRCTGARGRVGSLIEGKLVISRDDYERFPQDHPRAWQLLNAHFLTKSLLFLGLSFTDPNLNYVFRLVRNLRTKTLRGHYTVLKRPRKADDLQLHQQAVNDLDRVGVHVIEVDEYSELEDVLRAVVARARPHRLFVAGSPPSVKTAKGSRTYEPDEVPDELRAFCDTLGKLLADAPIPLMTAGGVGAMVGYAMLKQLAEENQYHHELLTVVRRTMDERVDYPNERFGQLKFVAADQTGLRGHAFESVRAMLLIGGSAGSEGEVTLATSRGIGVIPVAMTGGAAARVWKRISSDFAAYRLGNDPVDRRVFDRLNNARDPHSAARAAVQLVRQALFVS